MNAKICRNNHQSRDAAARFCIICGAPVQDVAPLNNQPQQRVQTNQPQQIQQPATSANYNYYSQPQQPFQPISVPRPVPPPHFCRVCGGDGRGLPPQILVCQECGWLRPLAPGYEIDCAAFQWAEDGRAMSALRSITPLMAAAKAISDKIGRRWVEATFNGVRLSEWQLPEIYHQAVKAARILGMSHLPDVYVSGEFMWDCRTYGSDKNSFIVVGTALATNFRGDEMLFLLAREMGHCRAGHALWKTVIKFLLGEQGLRKGLFANGILGALNPSALIEGALEMPLLAWARQAEITADRAGLLALGDKETARRVLLSWSLKSAFLYKSVNVKAWLEQQAAQDDGMTRLSEIATSATPYITRRLRLLEDFAASEDLRRWRGLINSFFKSTAPPPKSPLDLTKQNAPPPSKLDADVRLKCFACGAPMRIPQKILAGKTQLAVKCPNPVCGKVATLKRQSNINNQTASDAASAPPKLSNQERNAQQDDD
jgi:Zn-dependent protease with chaperone function